MPAEGGGPIGRRGDGARAAGPSFVCENLEPRLLLSTYDVTNINDSGAGSLRQALLDANANAGLDTITFNIAGGGVHTIIPLSALPDITEAVILDATSQPGYAGTPVIELNGVNAGNNRSGLTLESGSDGSTIRGLALNRFGGDGIHITHSSGNLIEYNFIGTDPTGTLAQGNGGDGIEIYFYATNNVIRYNLISANAWGISIGIGNVDDARNVIQANKIGTDVTGTLPLGNTTAGITAGFGSTNTLIGGSAAGQGNIIAFNGIGIELRQNAAGHSFLGNSIFSNASLGIDLGSDGVTANDTGDGDSGANNRQNFPVLTSAQAISGTQVAIAGSLNSTANSFFRIEFFANTAADGSGYGQGQRYLGFANVATDGAGNAVINAILTAAVAPGEFITATATRSDSTFSALTDSSEFARNIIVAINHAPVLDPTTSPALTAVNQDAGAPSGAVGTLISSLVDFAVPAGQMDNVTDADSGALLGIAVTAADTSNGTWYYSTDGGTTWNALGTVADSNARLLAAGANTRLYFQPNGNYHGTLAAAITFRAWDQTAGSNGTLADTTVNGGTTAFSTATDTASLTVHPLVHTPSVTDATTDEDTQTTGGLVISRNAADGAEVTHFKITGITNGTLYQNDGTTPIAEGSFITVAEGNAGLKFTPAANFNGSGYFTVQASTSDSDAGLGGGTVVATITIRPVNDAPMLDLDADDSAGRAGADFAATFTEGGPAVSIADADAALLDVDSATLSSLTVTITNLRDGAAESLAANTTGTSIIASYNRSTGVLTLSGTDSVAHYQQVLRTVSYRNTAQAPDAAARLITFVANDGARDSNIGTTTVTIVAVNNPPVVNDQSFWVDENATSGTSIGAVVASDPEAGDSLTYAITAGNTGGAFAINSTTGEITVANGAALDYETNPTFTLTVEVTDSGTPARTGSATVTIHLADRNEAPTAIDLSPGRVDEHAANGTVIGTVLASDVDAGDRLTYALVAGNTGGAFTINGTTGEITVARRAALDYETNPTFRVTVRVTDTGGLAAEATVTINLNGVNEAPIILAPAVLFTQRAVPLVFRSADGTGISIRDVDAGAGHIQMTIDVTNGDVTLAGTAGLTFVLGEGVDDAVMIFTGSIAAINAALEGMTFKPQPDYIGRAILQLTVDDQGNSGSGGPLVDARVVNILVGVTPPPPDEPEVPIPPEPENPEPELPPLDIPEPEDLSEGVSEPTIAAVPAEAPVVPNAPTVGNALPRQDARGDATPAREPVRPAQTPKETKPDESGTPPAEGDMSGEPASQPQERGQDQTDINAASAAITASVHANTAMWSQVESMKKQMDRAAGIQHRQQAVAVGVATGMSMSFAAGYVIWLLRGGSLLASLLAASPLWKSFDPLPVLAFWEKRKKERRPPEKKDKPNSDDEHELDELFGAWKGATPNGSWRATE